MVADRFTWFNAIMDSEKVPATDKLVAVAVWRYADKHGECFPSVPRIAANVRKHVSTVQRSMRRLEDWGWLKVEFRRREPGSWDTNLYSLAMPAAEKQATTSKNKQEGWSHPCDQGGSTGDRGVVAPMRPEHTKEHIKEQTTAAHPRSAARALSDENVKIKSSREGEPGQADPDRLEIVRYAAKRYLGIAVMSDAWAGEVLGRFCESIPTRDLEETVTGSFTSMTDYWREMVEGARVA